MYSKKLSNPLYKRVSAIALAGTRNNEIRNTAFDGIRNKQSVRAILLSMGFTPCNYTKPVTWRLKKRVGPRETPNTVVEMRTKCGQEVLDQLKSKGVIDTSEWTLSKKYLSVIIHDIRSLGYNIRTIKKGRFATHYTLDEQ